MLDMDEEKIVSVHQSLFFKEARSELSFRSSLLGHMVLTCNDVVLFGFVLGYQMLAV